ncbi:MAG: DUF1552 domain-containing protein, partial [Gemmataceae bacterium]
ELRLSRLEKDSDLKGVPDGVKPPNPTPRSMKEHLQLLGDMMVLAFQTDQTRICTFVFANEGSNRSYNEIQVPDGHHDLSHHGRNKDKLTKIQKINRFHVDQFAYVLAKLKAVKEGQGSLLDNCMIVYGSGNSDGDRHNHDDLPILLMGKAGGTLKPGRHLVFPQNTPLNNLWLELLDRLNVEVDRFGDSNGRLKNLNG